MKAALFAVGRDRVYLVNPLLPVGVQLNDRFMVPANRYTLDICRTGSLMTYRHKRPHAYAIGRVTIRRITIRYLLG